MSYKRLYFIFFNFGVFLIISIGVYAQEATESPDLPQVPVVGPSQVGLYQLAEYQLQIDNTLYANPFDIDDIRVEAVFERPDGEQVIIPGFWMQLYDENLILRREASWFIRMTPSQTGTWQGAIDVYDDGQIIARTTLSLDVTQTDLHGFIRVGSNQKYFSFDDGTAFFPIGHNLNWSWNGAGGYLAYENWLDDLQANHANFARIVIDVPWFIGLEWRPPIGDYRTAQEQAARLDRILEMAEERGIYLQLVILWHQGLRFYNPPPVTLPPEIALPDMSADWDNNPYNIANGGILESPEQFFENPQARQLFARRLRYIIARWGYSPHILAWELSDALDRTANFTPEIAALWVTEQAEVIHSSDAHGHLLTLTTNRYIDGVTNHPGLDFLTMSYHPRQFATGDYMGAFMNTIEEWQQPDRPLIVGSHSLSPWIPPLSEDPSGIHFQNALWGAVFAGTAGGAMSDWWDTYILPLNLSHAYIPLSDFVDDIDWSMMQFVPVEAQLIPLSDHTGTVPVDVITLWDVDAGIGIAWLHHRDDTWLYFSQNGRPSLITLRYQLASLPAGNYSVELWNPTDGVVLGQELAVVGDDGVLTFDLLPMNRQLALRFFRQDNP
ncbi:MAG: DUF5060 domain-containing protein [Chloroflexi bacterium]|nr:MAG: DUF5060 domain-containing protein [Chloroflexota bacterium]